MTQLYSYDKECPSCGRTWQKFSKKPNASGRPAKCPECKSGDVSDPESKPEHLSCVKDRGGIGNKDKRCAECKHFRPTDDRHPREESWGHCELGHTLPKRTAKEYTLTWAINNLDRCPMDEQDYASYGYNEEDLTLIHAFDLCGSFEKREEDGG